MVKRSHKAPRATIRPVVGEVLAIAAVLAGGCSAAGTALKSRRARLTVVAGAAAGLVAIGLFPRRPADGASLRTPARGTTIGYVSSSACRSCHPGEHASFGRTFHRTMTQAASRRTVLAPVDNRTMLDEGRETRLFYRGDEVWARLPDPDAVIAGRIAADVERRVVMTTGSHREQAFWVDGERPGDLRLVPFVWLLRERRFVARRDAFLTPPGEPMPPVRWGSSCIACHAVAGEPHHDLERDTFDMRAAELGVACEACHGPGARHVERHRDPVERYAQHASSAPDPTIVHPAKLSPERSMAVCGQCHSYAFPRDEAAWWQTGFARAFAAGDTLEPSRILLSPTMGAGAPSIDLPADAVFWPDGSVRVGGREYNGLVASACFAKGVGERTATCLSCHAMHRGDPAGQLAPERRGDAACTGCHASTKEHSRHAIGSPGAACVACHMPKTSFALLSAVRSHRIDSPRVAPLPAKPSACSLCHLDRPAAWAAETLQRWFPASSDGRMRPPDVPAGALRPDEVAAGLVYGLSADAGVRALIADAAGDPRSPAGEAFRVALLREMKGDPYAAVRFIAERSLRGARRLDEVPLRPDEVPLLDRDLVRRLLAVRDDRAITIAE